MDKPKLFSRDAVTNLVHALYPSADDDTKAAAYLGANALFNGLQEMGLDLALLGTILDGISSNMEHVDEAQINNSAMALLKSQNSIPLLKIDAMMAVSVFLTGYVERMARDWHKERDEDINAAILVATMLVAAKLSSGSMEPLH